MADQLLADHARQALEAYRAVKDECAHLCGCRRSSSVVDSTIRVALDLGGWGYGSLAKELDVSKALIQKRARR